MTQSRARDWIDFVGVDHPRSPFPLDLFDEIRRQPVPIRVNQPKREASCRKLGREVFPLCGLHARIAPALRLGPSDVDGRGLCVK